MITDNKWPKIRKEHQNMAIALVVLLFAISVVHVSSAANLGPRCFVCHDVKHPSECHHMRRCDPGQICATEKYRHDHEIMMRFHCVEPWTCQGNTTGLFGKKRDSHDRTICSQCCSGEFCNRNLCQPAQTTVDSHMCLHCADVERPEDCIHMRQCHKDEVCSTEHLIDKHGEHQWKLGCTKAHDCPSIYGSIFGKKRGNTHVCDDCCDGYMCNANQCGQTPYQAPTTQPIAVWSAWQNSSACSVTCGTGSIQQTRQCSTGNSQDCQGLSTQSVACQEPACPVVNTATAQPHQHLAPLAPQPPQPQPLHQGPRCLDCHDVKHAGECTTIRRCAPDEVCSTEVMPGHGHDNVWRFHCKRQHECANVVAGNVFGKKRAAPPPAPGAVCSKCCHNDLCNVDLCQPAHTILQAPLCLDCPDVHRPEDCNRVRTCHAIDEFCSTEHTIDHGQDKWKFGCVKLHDCPGGLLGIFGRKRGGGGHVQPICHQCCRDWLCNNNMCGASPQHITTISATTTTTTTTAAPTTTTTTTTTTTPAPTTTTTTTTLAPTTTATTTTTTPAPTTTTTTTIPTTHVTLYPCIDIESATVICTTLQSLGHCQKVPGNQYETMKLRCRKTCGFC